MGTLFINYYGGAPPTNYTPILPSYSGLQYNASASQVSSIDFFDGALFVGTQKDSRTSTPILIAGLNKVDPSTFTRTAYQSGGGASWDANCNGVAVSSDRQRLLVSWPNTTYSIATGMRIGQFIVGSGTTAASSSTFSHPSAFQKGFELAGENSGVMYATRTNGTNGGDCWITLNSDNYNTFPPSSELVLNDTNGMTLHSGGGSSLMLFDGYMWCGGSNTLGTSIPLWKASTALTPASAAWQGNITAIQNIRTTNIQSTYSGSVIVTRTSDISATKRLYVFMPMANGFAYKTTHDAAWVSGTLPSGEYFASYRVVGSNSGKCYFVTTTGTSTSNNTWRLRSIDESGTIALLATLPTNSTMFPLGWTSGVYCVEVVVEPHPITGAVVAVGVWMYGGTAANVGNFYLHAWSAP